MCVCELTVNVVFWCRRRHESQRARRRELDGVGAAVLGLDDDLDDTGRLRPFSVVAFAGNALELKKRYLAAEASPPDDIPAEFNRHAA